MSGLADAADIGLILLRSMREAGIRITPEVVPKLTIAVLGIGVGDWSPFLYSVAIDQFERILMEDVRR